MNTTSRFVLAGAMTLVLGFGVGMPLLAVFERPYPLAALLRESQFIFEAKVLRIDATKQRFVAEVTRNLKGEIPFARLNVNLSRTKKKEDPQKMLRRLEAGRPLVVFAFRAEDSFLFVGFSEGTWFRLASRTPPGSGGNKKGGAGERKSAAVCSFVAFEIYLRRTFAGTTTGLLAILPEVLAGKKEPPALDPKVKPGLGPEIRGLEEEKTDPR